MLSFADDMAVLNLPASGPHKFLIIVMIHAIHLDISAIQLDISLNELEISLI